MGIGRERGTYLGITREWLYWYDKEGKRYLTPEERVLEAEERVLEAEQREKKLEERLRSLGVDLDCL